MINIHIYTRHKVSLNNTHTHTHTLTPSHTHTHTHTHTHRQTQTNVQYPLTTCIKIVIHLPYVSYTSSITPFTPDKHAYIK